MELGGSLEASAPEIHPLEVIETSNGAGESSESGENQLPGFIKQIHGKIEETGDLSTVYLVGTAHVSKKSCEEVEAAIRLLKPKAVFIELCKDRRWIVMQPEKHEIPTFKSMLESWRTKRMNAFGLCYSYFLAQVADKLDVVPGAEFKTAFEEGNACHADIFFGDRPVNITLQRTWSRMSFWMKLKLTYHMLTNILLLPSVEELNKMLAEISDTDAVTLLIREYSKSFPTLIDSLLTERDLFMTFILQSLSQKYTSTVAVVGRGHVPGIIDNWEKAIEVRPLLEVPKKKSWKLGWALGACGVVIGVIYWKHRQGQII